MLQEECVEITELSERQYPDRDDLRVFAKLAKVNGRGFLSVFAADFGEVGSCETVIRLWRGAAEMFKVRAVGDLNPSTFGIVAEVEEY